MLVEIALSIALAAVLRRFAVVQLPAGGDVSLAMLPIGVLALRRGVGPGILAGVLFAPLDLLLFPTPIVHWVQPILDYPVAYGLVGLAGFAAPLVHKAAADGKPLVEALAAAAGMTLGVVARFVAHFVSGIVFFGSYAPAGQPVAVYSAVYNATYLLPSLVACAVAAAIVVPVLERTVPSGTLSWSHS